jgi:TonB family protein
LDLSYSRLNALLSVVTIAAAIALGESVVQNQKSQAEKIRAKPPRQDDATKGHALLGESWARKSAVSAIMPAYPDEAVRLNISAVVRIKLEVSRDGEVLQIKVKPKTKPVFTKAVAQAVKQWLFKPWSGPDGLSQPVISRLSFRFIILEGEPYVEMYDPGTSDTDCLDCYNSALELREWREWDDVPLDRKPK